MCFFIFMINSELPLDNINHHYLIFYASLINFSDYK